MEGFGLTPLEAMGHNCLPVISRIDAFSEVCKNAALYFNPTSIAEIEEAILEAINMDEGKRKGYNTKFKERVEKFSWEKSLEETLKVYESCISV